MKDDIKPVPSDDFQAMASDNSAPPTTYPSEKLDSHQTTETEYPKLPAHASSTSWFTKMKKKLGHVPKKYVALSVVGGLIISAGIIVYLLQPNPPQPALMTPTVIQETEPPKPTTVASRLTGVQIKPELDKLPTTAVMLENSPDARPQSGLREAGVVYEAIAEGGITRFLAIYQETKPGYIGPVRSVRPYYLDFLVPYDAPVAHVGGSAVALDQIRRQGIKDLDQFHNPSAYHRITSRYAPHNMYTDRNKLLDIQKKKGFTKSKFEGFARKKAEPADKPTAKKIDLNISGYLYNSQFVYHAKSNSYRRNMGGKPHIDDKSKKQLSPDVVVALVMPHSYSGIYSVYKTTGSGKVYVFQDGVKTEGTWHKKNRKDQLTLKTKDGEPLALNPGQTWVTLVDNSGQVEVR